MIEQLLNLEKVVLDMRKQYHITSAELVNLRAKYESALKQQKNSEHLSQQLSNVQAQLYSVQTQRDELTEQIQELEERNEELSSEHSDMSGQFNELKSQIEELTLANKLLERKAAQKIDENNKLRQDNRTLLEKNRIGAEHIRTALEKLTLIDKS